METHLKRMPILPMWQPYASLTLHKNPQTGLPYKQWETRPNKPPKTIWGKTILIHACAKWDIGLAFMSRKEPFLSALNNIIGIDIATHPLFMLDEGKPKRGSDKLPFGAIIGSWEIEEYYMILPDFDAEGMPGKYKFGHSADHCKVTEMERSFGDYQAGRWGWKIKNPRLLKEPILFKGNQGINYIELDPERLQYI